jgi:protein-glutamine gamma-glutamyltransferase
LPIVSGEPWAAPTRARGLREHLVVLPVLVAVAVHAIATGVWPLSLVLAVLTLAATVRARALPRRPHVVIALAAALAFALLALALPPPGQPLRAELVGASTRALASAFLAIAIVAIFARAPARSRDSPLLFVLAAMVACGMARVSTSYLPLAVAFVTSVIVTLACDREAGPRLRRLRAGRLVAAAIAWLLALAVAIGFILLLPPANQRVTEWVMGWARLPSLSGMGDGIQLQGNTDISLSDEVVLRVRGDSPELLRGFVLTAYRRGRWTRERARLPKRVESAPRSSASEIEVVPIKQAAQYFLPLGATAVRLQSGHALRDSLGQWTASADEIAGAAWFSIAQQPDIEPPTPADRAVATELAEPLARLAQDWTGGSAAPSARMDKLVARLQTGFAYSLHHSRQTQADPVLDFLESQRSGHCEYFASALALLARGSGIPARVVTGYRAHELNAVGGYRVVRERDAHAWVEAWIDGRGWQSYDATPDAYFEAMADRTPFMRGLLDWLATPWHEGAALRALLLWTALLGVPIAITVIVIGRLRRRKARARQEGSTMVEKPWPAMAELLRLLARRGSTRDPGETLEHFGRRLRTSGRARTAALIEDYARFRYGGLGQRQEIEPQLRAETQELLRERRQA